MADTCPNINSPEFLSLESTVGTNMAYLLFDIAGDPGVDLYNEIKDKELSEVHKKQILSLKNRRRELEGETDPTERQKIRKRIEVISASIERLKNDVSYETILYVALADLRECQEIIKKPDISDKEIAYIGATLERLSTLDDLINAKVLSNNLLGKLQYINTETNNLVRALKIAQGKLIERISSSEGVPTKMEDLLSPAIDISVAKRKWLGMDTTKIPILRLADSMFETIKRKTNATMFKFNKELSDIRKKFNKKDDFKNLLDARGRIITETKGEYFDDERDMLKKITQKLTISRSAKERLLIYKEKDDWYIENNNYVLTKEGETIYNDLLEAKRAAFVDENGKFSNEADEKSFLDWETANSPYLGIQYANQNIKTFGNYYWYRFLNQSPKEKYINKEFYKVKDNELYKFVVKTITDGMKKIPHSMTVDLNSFDKVLNSVLFDLNKENEFVLKAAWQGLGDFISNTFKVAISQRSVEGKSGKMVNEKGEEISKLSPKSITEIQQEKQFKNPIELVEEFYKLAVSYEHKTQIEPAIWLLKGLLDTQEAIRTDKKTGIPERDTNNPTELALIEGGLTNAKSMFMTNILAELYDTKRLDVGSAVPTPVEARNLKIIHDKWIVDKREAIKNGTAIPKEPVLTKVSGIKIIDAIVDFTRLNLLWFKPLSAINNIIIGFENTFLHASRGIDFTDAELFSAIKILGNSVIKYVSFGKVESEEAQKIKNMANYMGISEESLVGDNTYKENIIKYGLSWQSSGEYLVGNQILIAKMLNEKIKNLKGEEVSLWYAFDKDANFKVAEFGELDEAMIKKVKDRIREIRKQTQGDYQNVMQAKSTVDGRVITMFRTWLPRAVHQRFGEQVGNEFKGRYLTYRDVHQSYVEANHGFWQGTGKMAAKQFLATLTKIANVPGFSQLGMKSLSELCNKEYEEDLKNMGLSDLDIQNMRMNIRELQHLVYISLIILALGGLAAGGGPPDPELTLAQNLGTRIYQDMSFFYSFNSAESITKDPIPIYRTIQDAYSLVGNTMNYIQNSESDIYERGRNEGESKTIQSLYKFIPGLSAYESTLNTMSEVYGKTARK